MTQPNICPTCSTPMNWEDCDDCGGSGYIDAYDIAPLTFPATSGKECQLCSGFGGWYVCPNYHNHPTETNRTASDPAGTTPAGTPAPLLAGCQQPRQQKMAL